jgi:16S rRNA (cytosine1402-N4)-methyltransferase
MPAGATPKPSPRLPVIARHEPVLVAEVLGFIARGPGLYLDATLGDGGHAEALLEREPGARLWGNDRDPSALAAAGERLGRHGSRVMLSHGTFVELPTAWERAAREPLAGALFDLGLSSRQLDDPARGMSFRHDAPLDLRLDPTRGEPAAAWLARAEADEVAQVLREHGDVAGAGRLARAIVAAARRGELPTTRALAAWVDRALGGRPHPRRTAQVFQALRIWVNDEARDLEAALAWLPDAMAPGGVVVTIAYHSGEDRRIKQSIRPRPMANRRLQAPPPTSPWEELTRKVCKPTDAEQRANPRSRSARLRAFRRKSA